MRRRRAQGSVLALVAMAFFAVLRGPGDRGVPAGAFGPPTITSPRRRPAGRRHRRHHRRRLRGGIRINLARFFRIPPQRAGDRRRETAGRRGTAHGQRGQQLQGQALDLSWLVVPGR
jgi:hypothetical protein